MALVDAGVPLGGGVNLHLGLDAVFAAPVLADLHMTPRGHNLLTDQKKGSNAKFCAASAIFLLTPLRHAGGPQ